MLQTTIHATHIDEAVRRRTRDAAVCAGSDEDAIRELDESCFVHESVRRYLPDACRHYVALVRAASGPARAGARAAGEQSLRRQLDALHGRLAQILAAAIATRAETLRQHETFIAGKRS